MKKTCVFIILFFVYSNSFSQYNFKNKQEVAFFNIISSGIIGGVGALVNNNHKQKNIKAFYKGFYKGVLSGAIIYVGKDVISEYPRTKNFGYIWGSKVLIFTGVSMLENTVENKKLFNDIHFNLGFVRFDIFPYDKFKIKPRLMPISLLTTTFLLTKYKLDTKFSLQTGNFIFTSSNFRKTNYGLVYGTAFGNNIFVTSKKADISRELVLTHELIHVYQLNSFSSLNTFYYKLENKIFGKKSYYKWYNKFFNTDYNDVTFGSIYSILRYYYNFQNGNYSRNVFEGEAFIMMEK